jgi:hypothetical protein
MISFGRWAMIGVFAYCVYLLARFYIASPSALLDGSRTGLGRLTFACFLCVAIFLLGRSIVRERLRSNSSNRNVRPVRTPGDELQNRREHPFVVAFKMHPFLTSIRVLALSCTLFLLQVVSHPERPLLDRANLRWLAAGLFFLAVGIAVLHFKARSDSEKQP